MYGFKIALIKSIHFYVALQDRQGQSADGWLLVFSLKTEMFANR